MGHEIVLGNEGRVGSLSLLILWASEQCYSKEHSCTILLILVSLYSKFI